MSCRHQRPHYPAMRSCDTVRHWAAILLWIGPVAGRRITRSRAEAAVLLANPSNTLFLKDQHSFVYVSKGQNVPLRRSLLSRRTSRTDALKSYQRCTKSRSDYNDTHLMLGLISGFTKWFVRTILLLGVLTVACAAGVQVYRHDVPSAIVLFLCLTSTMFSTRRYFEQDRHAITFPCGPTKPIAIRLAAFWSVMVLALVVVVWILGSLRNPIL